MLLKSSKLPSTLVYDLSSGYTGLIQFPIKNLVGYLWAMTSEVESGSLLVTHKDDNSIAGHVKFVGRFEKLGDCE